MKIEQVEENATKYRMFDANMQIENEWFIMSSNKIQNI